MKFVGSKFSSQKQRKGKSLCKAIGVATLCLMSQAAVGKTTTKAKETITFGVVPWQKGQDNDDIIRKFLPLKKHIEKHANINIKMTTAETYDQMIKFLAEGQVNIASISPVPYVMANNKNNGVQVLMTNEQWNDDKSKKTDSYLAHFITHKDNKEKYNKLEDLKGKKFAFVKKSSSSGFIYPESMLRDEKINYETYFSVFSFLGSHPNVTDAIANKTFDAGATWDFNLEQAIKKHGDVFHIIKSSDPIPNLCIATHPSINHLREKIKAALKTATEKDHLQGLPMAGFVEKPDSFYNVVRKVSGIEIKGSH